MKNENSQNKSIEKDWKKSRRKHMIFEVVALILMIGFVCLGIFMDYYVTNHQARFYVEANKDVAQMLLPIQATIMTLTIAILALLGGRISDSYMGISCIDYFLNHKPFLFKQKTIIISSVILLIINILFYQWSFLFTEGAIFIIECILIIISVTEIYELFSQRVKPDEEIRKYILKEMHFGKSQRKMKLLSGYTLQWERIILQQNQIEFDDYVGVYKEIFETLFLDALKDSRKQLQSSCQRLIHMLLTSYNQRSKVDGLWLLDQVYQWIWKKIEKNHGEIYKAEDEFQLFQEVCWDVIQNMDDMPVYILQKKFDVDMFLACLERATVLLMDEEQYKTASEWIEDFAAYVGLYLSKQERSQIQVFKWSKPVSYIKNGIVNIPDDKVNTLQTHEAKSFFKYAKGLICGGMLEILKDGLFINVFNKMYRPKCVASVRACMAVHCFLYYTAEREDGVFIPDHLKEKCREFLRNEEIQQSFTHFLRGIFNLQGLWNENLENSLFDLLRSSEFMPRSQMVKTMIMEGVVRDYLLCTAFYLSGIYYIPNFINDIIPEKEVGFYLQNYLGKREPRTKDLVTEFFVLLGDKEENVQNKVDTVFSNFDYQIKTRFKDLEIKKAQIDQEEYEAKVQEKESPEIIVAQKVKEYISEVFCDILSGDAKEYEKCIFPIDNILFYTGEDPEQIVYGINDVIGVNFLKELIDYLYEKEMVSLKIRDNLLADEDWLTNLEAVEEDFVIGSEYAMKPKDYENMARYDRFLEDKTCVFLGYGSRALLLKKEMVKMYIQEVNVQVIPVTIQDKMVDYDKDKNEYLYEFYNDIPIPFSEDELKKFLHDREKIMHIEIIASIKGTGELVGEIIDREL